MRGSWLVVTLCGQVNPATSLEATPSRFASDAERSV